MTRGVVPETLETRRIGVFLAVTFLFSWSMGAVLVVALRGVTGGVARGIAAEAVAVVVMAGPAIGHVVARTVTGEGWTETGDGGLARLRPRADTFLAPRIRDGWPYYLTGWLLPAAFALAGAAIYFVAVPEHFAGLAPLREGIAFVEAETGQPVEVSPVTLFAMGFLGALTITVPLYAVATFGEEFGWRAYLLPKLLALGPRRGLVALGIVWGVWHWPLVAVGNNYGLDYPFAPFPGLIAILWFTTVVGVVFAWLTLRSGTVWPAVIAHASLNATSGIGLLLTTAEPTLLLGPTPAGLLGSIPFALLAGWILLDPDRIAPASGGPADDDRDPGAAAPAATVDAPGASGSAAAVPDDEPRE